MFEVEDLSVASPATISRNGMIYIEPPYLLPEKTAPERASETPLLKTWLEQLPDVFKPQRDFIAKLVNTYLVVCTELLRLELEQPVACTMPNVICGLTRMLDCLFLPCVPVDTGEEPDPEVVREAPRP